MGLLGESFVVYLLTTVLGLITLAVLYLKYQYSYWKKRNVVHMPPSVPFGNFTKFFFQKCSTGEQITELYNQLRKSRQRFAGIYLFSKPVLLVIDPELAKSIMTKDFQYFSSRGNYSDEENDPLTGHLLNLNGTEWKGMRSKLTPTFTSGKMKMMFQTLVACSQELEVVLEKHSKMGIPLDVKDTMGRFTTDIIGSCAFGIDCNSLKEPENEFRRHGKRIFELTYLDNLRILFSNQFPKIFTALGMKRFPKEQNDFFMKLVRETVDYRVKNNFNRKDFMQLLIQLKEHSTLDGSEEKDGNKLSMNQVAAQSFVFFLAGFETSSTTLASFMYEMARHQDVQDKVREEIHEMLNKYDRKITYEGIMEMEYLGKAIDGKIN